ncbi:MAG TPA: phosphoadenylyl-sulfate reductase [Bacteroidales bacterium]|jgi:phosphoadenosine phosphosulfate reductase|nr:phosphoadenylyl-sulfate reductase [Bacteroidales bacterium]HOX78149.1 phosphoadenylyl-sulfate reductase [Bacteroidales bacterium]HPI86711.1 phosphoadenylyl-sulfate reductase [Bacteroidales bacterium]HPM92094.1 phosphoadenylyl-sulfate reductase [Bacteroidales bacterium]
MEKEFAISYADKLNRDFADRAPEDIIAYIIENHRDRAAFSTSLGLEDQALTAMIARIDPGFPIFTLDTGRLFAETYDLIDLTSLRYNVKIKVYFPDNQKVEEMVSSRGINLFYDSVENRKLCCHIRKIEPLQRALTGVDFWISGLRREQSVTRENLTLAQYDPLHHKIKINPLINWTYEQVQSFIKINKVPYNPLHDKGFPSIGCQPCTRAVEPGDDIRSGRWWWENPEMKECGLHK